LRQADFTKFLWPFRVCRFQQCTDCV